MHQAPGEAEAECALLQREGIVDAVLSEDVDTLMFGCGLTLRNWSSEGSRGNKSPTHVSVYHAKATKQGKSGLDREAMVLVALMSGGDYITDGIPGCGIKVACEAARAGYGKSLCQLSRSDTAGLEAWRKDLVYEVQTNESKYFRVRHKTLKIPDNFPDREVLGYYTHPVVSSAAKVQKLKDDIQWDGQVDIPGLRLFVAEAFDWTHKIGAKKFIRGIAPALLVHKLRIRGDRRDSGYGDVGLTAMNEMELVRAICGKRTHFSTDGVPELRVVYLPIDIVGLGLDAEADDTGDYGRDGLAPMNDDDEIEAYASDDATSRSRSASPIKRAASQYDPAVPDKIWISEIIAKVGVPLKVEDYEESLRDPKKFLKQKAAAKKAATKGEMQNGAMDRFVKISKARQENVAALMKPPSKSSISASQEPLPPVYLAPSPELLPPSQPATSSKTSRSTRSSTRINTEPVTTKSTTIKPKPKTRNKAANTKPQPSRNLNPWTLASSHNCSSPAKITKPITRQKPSTPPLFKQIEFNTEYLLSSSPVVAPQSSPLVPSPAPTTPRKHRHSPSPSPERQNFHLSSEDHEDHGKEEGEEEQDLELPSTLTRTRDSRCSSPFHHSSPPSPIHSPINSDLDLEKPSPRKKKKSPVSMSSLDRALRSTTEPLALSPEPVARLLDFSPHQEQRARSSSPALPTVSELLSSRKPDPDPSLAKDSNSGYGESHEVITLSSSPPIPAVRSRRHLIQTHLPPNLTAFEEDEVFGALPGRHKQKKEKMKYIMLRESLPGAWKEIGEDTFEQHAAIGDDKGRGRGREKGWRAWRMSQVEVLDLSGDS